MHLHVWHMAGSQAESEDKLASSQLLFVGLSEMSSVLPVVMQHPVLLDVASREVLVKTDEPLAPFQFRSFRLHTVWTSQAGEDLVHHVAFPHFLGEADSPMLEYEPERIPQELTQSPKMAVNLRPPSNNHWNIASDLVLPLIQGTLQQQREAKQAALHQEERSRGQRCPQQRYLLQGSPSKWRQKAAERHPWQECSPQAACDRDYAGDLRAHPCSRPPDYARDGEGVGARSDSSPHTHGRVHEAAAGRRVGPD